MVGSRLNVHLYRDSFNTPWGFRLQGGTDLNQPLVVQRVFSNSPAEGELQRGDVILSINNKDGTKLTHKQAQDSIKHGGGQVDLVVNRPPPGSGVAPLSPPIVTQLPRAPSLQQEMDKTKMEHVIKLKRAIDEDSTPATHDFVKNRLDRLRYIAESSSSISHSRPTQMSMYSRDSNPKTGTPLNQPLHVDSAPPPDRSSRGYSQPPITPSTPPPPWATQQPAPRRVARKSQLGGKGGFSFGTDYATMPRSRSQSSAQYGRRPRPGDEAPEGEIVEPDRLASGPIPKVCSRSNLGGGGLMYGSSYNAGPGSASTLPRRASRQSSQPPTMPSAGATGFMPKKITLNKIGGGGPEFGSDFNTSRYSQITPAQRYEPVKDPMLNRVQSNLENVTLSPRTPEVHHGSPFYQPAPEPVYQPPPAAPQPSYNNPNVDFLDQQRLQDQQNEAAFLGKAGQMNSIPTVPKPTSFGSSKYADFGTDYRNPQQKSTWRPAPQVAYKPAPPAPVQQTAPVWQKPPQVDEEDATPAWKNTLRSSGVKPWERDLVSAAGQESPRSVPYQPPAPAPMSPAQAAFSPAPMSPAPPAFSPVPVAQPEPVPLQKEAPSVLPMPGSEEPQSTPKVVHLQYNSPMGLYSDKNVEETLAGQTAAIMEQSKPTTPSNQPGARDWSQSAVLQFIEAENQRHARPRPRTAPKPQHQATYEDYGATDF